MRPWKAATVYLLTTLPGDMKVALTIISSKKLQTCVIFLSLLALTLLAGLLTMWIATSNQPSVAVQTDYWGLAFRRLSSASGRELPGMLLDTAKIYLDYPAVWFTFERIGFEEQARTLAMDTTTAFPVINLRYVLDNAPLALLLSVYVVLSRHRVRGMRPVHKQNVAQVVSISLPGAGGAMGSVLAPMACCGGTAVQSAAYIVGFVAAAPVVTVFSRLAIIGVGVLVVIGIAWTARKINSSGSCGSP